MGGGGGAKAENPGGGGSIAGGGGIGTGGGGPPTGTGTGTAGLIIVSPTGSLYAAGGTAAAGVTGGRSGFFASTFFPSNSAMKLA